jgi:CRP/FNR family cyclic AMP-dependent transcriptional regulator
VGYAVGLFDYGVMPKARAPGPADFVFLDGLSGEAWKKILAHAQIVHFRADQELIRAGDLDDSFYILSQGSVDVVLSVRGKETILTTIPEGSVFGEVAFFDRARRSATIRARSSGSAVCLTREGFDQLSAWEPQLARAILIDLGRVLALRLRNTTQRSQT